MLSLPSSSARLCAPSPGGCLEELSRKNNNFVGPAQVYVTWLKSRLRKQRSWRQCCWGLAEPWRLHADPREPFAR